MSYEYDDIANTIVTTNENGAKIKYIYNGSGQIISVQDISGTDPIQLAAYEYDSFLRISAQTDGNNVKTAYTYDFLDRKLTENTNDSASEIRYVYEDAFSSNESRVIKTIVGDENAPDIQTISYQNKYGQLIRESRVLDSVELSDIYRYDYLGNKTEYENVLNNVTKYQTDYRGNITLTVNPDGSRYQSQYDWMGRKIKDIDPKGNVCEYTYDASGNMLKEIIPFDNNANTVKTYVYDKNGNIIQKTISSNKPGEPQKEMVSKFEYNNNNFLVRVSTYDQEMNENYVEYAYDNIGNKTQMVTSNGQQTINYEYDSQNRLIKQTDALGQAELFTYDMNNNIVKSVDRNGNITENTYDAFNRLTNVQIIKKDKSIASEYISYTYSKTGAKVKEENENLTTTFMYDSLGRLITQIESNGIEKIYTYDAANNRRSFILKKGGSTQINQTYDYDEMNRLKKTYNFATVEATYTYDQNGNRETLSYPNGVTTEYTYNNGNMVTNLVNKNGNAILSNYNYTYYLDGNQATKTDHTGESTTYVYDGTGRLTNEITVDSAGSTASKSYTYDYAGNRKSMTVSETIGGHENSYATTYAYDANNRLLQETKKSLFEDEVTEYAYDANGNQISKIGYAISTSAQSAADLGIHVIG